MGGGGRVGGSGLGGGVRVDKNEELKFLRNYKKNRGGGGGRGSVWGIGLGGGHRVDVNAMLG